MSREPIIGEESTDYFAMYSASVTRCGQKITLAGDILSKVSFWTRKYGTPPGTIYARIRKVSNDDIIETSPTTYTAPDLSTDPAWKDFVFTCAPDEEVYISLEYDDGNADNSIRGFYYTPSTIIGEIAWYDAGWSSAGTHDCSIKIYFDGAPPAYIPKVIMITGILGMVALKVISYLKIMLGVSQMTRFTGGF